MASCQMPYRQNTIKPKPKTTLTTMYKDRAALLGLGSTDPSEKPKNLH
jgi:hypothetical protein